ncbi:hypothetical protein BCR36DRAFT_343216 [Piromyces finnis]|uniref:FYVE-type domain-containing protein n=1 Tax=Piromyces finnis TaxID=1754191 RepID=A0A1Y1VLV7_9FUNG|nr:hypothetical protein BCR36DRAFT_343216 [Piromyces finnis]|eukprot:ORX59273.1 hypothetical protein BCR36DRAFT_343216 [Piromyces finnis]
MTKVNNNSKGFKNVIEESNIKLRIKRPTWISDDTVTICQGCKQYFSPFRRKHHCRNSGNIFCQNCSPNTTTLPFLGYQGYVRVCKHCLKLVELINKCLNKNSSVVLKLNCEYDLLNIILKGDEHTIQHFINYGGINILNYFCTLNHPAFCHLFLGIILNHITKFELSDKNSEELLEIFIRLTNLYMENINKITIETQYLLFLFQNLVVFLMHTLINENTKIIEGHELQIIKVLLNFSYLKLIREKIHNENDDNEQYLNIVWIIEKIISKTLSEFCKKKENQYVIFKNPEVFDLFYKGLTSNNDESKKYLAKSLAYLSLRNDQYKVLILKGSDEKQIKEHVNILVKCIIVDPEIFPDILNNFCNCCYTEYLKETETKEEHGSYLSHSYSPKRSSTIYKSSPLSHSLKSSNTVMKHARHRSTSSTSTPNSPPIIKKQLNLTPKTAIVSNLTKGLNSSHYRTTPTSPLSRLSISSNFDSDLPTSPLSKLSISSKYDPDLPNSPESLPSKNSFLNVSPSSDGKDKLGVEILNAEMIKKLKFQPEILFTTNILNSFLNEHQNHSSAYNLVHDIGSYYTVISHIVCTLANLVCQTECEELIMENEQIIYVLCLLIENHVKLITNSLQNKQASIVKLSTSLDIARHASRALGNIALNQNNIEMLFSLCTTKQPHIISALYSLLSLNDEAIQRQTLRIVSNIYSKKSINDLTTHSDTINFNLNTIQALMPQEQGPNTSSNRTSSFLSGSSNLNIPILSSSQEGEKDIKPHSISPQNESNNTKLNLVSPDETLINHFSPSSIDEKHGNLSSPIKSAGSDSRHSSIDRNQYLSLPPLMNENNLNNNNNNSGSDNNLHSKVHDSNYKRNSLQSHLNLNALTPIDNSIMMNINPDSLTFLYHIKYILRFIPIVNYCKDYSCTPEIKRKATSVLNKLKIIVKNYNNNIKKLNQL